MKNKLISIDPGTRRCGIAVFEEDMKLVEYALVTSKRKDYIDRIIEIVSNVINLLDKYSNELYAVTIERYYVHPRKGANVISEMIGILKYEIRKSYPEIFIINKFTSKQIHKLVSINDTDLSNKEHTKKCVVQLYINIQDNLAWDIYDAIALGYVTLTKHGGKDGKKKANGKVSQVPKVNQRKRSKKRTSSRNKSKKR